MVDESQRWWPLDLVDGEQHAFSAFRERMQAGPVPLDRVAAQRTVDLLAMGMRHHIEVLAGDDRLGSFCHLLNGWGELTVGGAKLSAAIERFVSREATGRCHIPQMTPEGEVHPWQTFAYAVMTGITPSRVLYEGGPTFRDLALNSRALPTRDADEFGHLLYSLATIEPDAGVPFLLEGERHTARQLVDMAIDAHYDGSFKVCRKVHLTEGISAAAARIPGLGTYREEAQNFLEGQLDVLFALGALLEKSIALHEDGQAPPTAGLVECLRDKLALNDRFENHTYLAGHLLELACLAHGLGYHLSIAHRHAMASVANSINHLSGRFVAGAAWPLCFLHFGHYRRGLSLLSLLDERAFAGALSPQDLRAFSIDFDALPLSPLGAAPSPEELQVFSLEPLPSPPRPSFAEAVGRFRGCAPVGFSPRGAFPHFRRSGPPSWPRALHYELLDHGNGLAIEIHLEDDALRPLAEPLRQLLPSVRARFADARVDWDDTWFAGCVRIRFSDDVAPDRVALALVDLIESTSPSIDRGVEELGRNLAGRATNLEPSV